eukprot:CAMPEP_0114277870 /NCGR_PEP_ID=MMETSP0059-20121206/1029_1 /TAXON_ID=36894 /ORGANISM="Pyramimonas parkeae, Strain CCMP726" /LENGTH=73 /DNA_ID=CAMNT_0001398021 /DNA_START=304 /DNA_END=525 /DNA_ORIENTATION=-
MRGIYPRSSAWPSADAHWQKHGWPRQIHLETKFFEHKGEKQLVEQPSVQTPALQIDGSLRHYGPDEAKPRAHV